MGDKSNIEWTDATWNPVIGCSRVSAGCQNCYAERVAHRGMAEQHRGLTVAGEKGPRWNGQVRFVPHVLDKPLRWSKPRRVFVNSLSDLFHEGLTDEQIAAVFGVMAASPQHTFQVLTKRPGRMVGWFAWAESGGVLSPGEPIKRLRRAVAEYLPGAGSEQWERFMDRATRCPAAWPLPNVWLGVSVEDQVTADERIPLLLEVPAALRWVSYEPALGPVDFRIGDNGEETNQGWIDGPELDWIVVGGESGPGARPFNVEWARSTIRQGGDAGVPVFVKQLGADPRGSVVPGGRVAIDLSDRKGGDWTEWPAELRVREMPF